ncbi:MAG: cell division protein FtsK, partial [Clostridium sp.]
MARGKGKNTSGTKSAKSSKGKKNVKDKKSETDNGDIKGIIYIAIGVLLAVAIYTSFAGALSIFAKKIIYNLIGVGAYILPAFLIYFGLDSIASKGSIRFSRRVFGMTLVVVMMILLCATT